MKYRVAFRSEYTKWEWVEISDHAERINAERHIAAILPEMQHSELAIFGMNEGASYWKDRKPRLLYNRQPGDFITPSLGGLINSLQSDWF